MPKVLEREVPTSEIGVFRQLGRSGYPPEHRTNGAVDNQRRICAYPQRAVYLGPPGGQNDRTHWVERNFSRR